MGNQNQFGQHAFAVASQPIGAIEPPSVLHASHAGLARYKEGHAPAGLQSAAQWLQESRECWEQVNQVRQVPDPSLTEEGHILQVNQVAERGVDKMVKGYDRARTALAIAEAGYQSEIDSATRLAPGIHAAEIRGVIRGMPDADRYATLIGAMNAGDVATLAAVLTAPGITSGLTDEQVGNLKSMYQRKAAAEPMAHLEAVRTAQRKTLIAFDSLLENTDALALRQRAGLVKERKRQAEEAARLASGTLDRWGQ